MTDSDDAWNERVAQERPKARTRPQFPWQVALPAVTSEEDRFTEQTGSEKVTVPKKGTVAEFDRETGSEKVTVSKKATVSEKVTVSETDRVIEENRSSATFRIPHKELDFLLSELTAGEFKLYIRLYRLSYGWGRDVCRIGDNNLMESLSLSRNTIREAKQGLAKKGLVEILQTVNLGPKGYTEYRVWPAQLTSKTGSEKVPVYKNETGSKKVTVPEKVTVPKIDPMKTDHDDDKKKDHHQSAAMRIYQTLTGNIWTKGDTHSYRKVAHLPLANLEPMMRTIHARAGEPIGSFAYFANSLLKEQQAGQSGISSRATLKKKYTALFKQIQTANVGGYAQISDLIYALKAQCVREGISWNDDVANEVVGI